MRWNGLRFGNSISPQKYVRRRNCACNQEGRGEPISKRDLSSNKKIGAWI